MSKCWNIMIYDVTLCFILALKCYHSLQRKVQHYEEHINNHTEMNTYYYIEFIQMNRVIRALVPGGTLHFYRLHVYSLYLVYNN